MAVFECDCCGLPRCERKLKGIGYYCDECFSVCYMEHEDACNPGGGPVTWPHKSDELHARLRGVANGSS